MKLRETSWVNLGRLEYNMLQLDIGHWKSSSRPQWVWTLDPLQGCVLSPLLFTLYIHDCTPRFQVNSIMKYSMRTTAHHGAALQTLMTVHIGRKSTIWQSGAQRTLYSLTPVKPKNWVLSFERRRQIETALSTSVELRWSRWIILGSFELQSLRTHLGPCCFIT